MERETGERSRRKSGYAERSAATPADQRAHTNATFVVESASPATVSSAIGDAAPAEQTVRTARKLLPWLAMAEGAYWLTRLSEICARLVLSGGVPQLLSSRSVKVQ